jgi:hypothetical protein
MQPLFSFAALFAAAVACVPALRPSQTRRDSFVTSRTRTEGDVALKLNLHLPAVGTRRVLIVWVHGGAWRAEFQESDAPRALRESRTSGRQRRLSPFDPGPVPRSDSRPQSGRPLFAHPRAELRIFPPLTS